MTCSTQDLHALVTQFRNGCNERYFHNFNRRFIYTDGVRDLAQLAGAYWLLDILATEVAKVYLQAWEEQRVAIGEFIIEVHPSGSKPAATLKLTNGNGDEDPPLWVRDIDFTDFPESRWQLYLGVDEYPEGGYCVTCILPTEY